MMNRLRQRYCIVGVGNTAFGKTPGQSQVALNVMAIRAALAEANGGIRRAAAKLGLSPQALLRRLEKWPELRVEKE